MSTLPFWLAEALAAEQPAPPTPLVGNHEVDVCIVGGGFTGLWSAIALKQAEPRLRILVLEKDRCGSGASGRNGGCLLTWSAKYLTLKRLFGEQQAAWLVQRSEQAVHEIARFCEQHHIEAELRVEGTCYTATSEAQRGLMEPVLRELQRAGLNQWQAIEEGELASQSGSHVHLEGLYSPHAGSVQPALLVRGLLRVARELGVEVYEHSPMQRLEADQPARVQTPQGEVRARKVVLALNSAMVQHFREFRRSIVLVSSDMVITDPAPDALAAQQLEHGRSVVDGRTFVHYYRSTPQGRLMLGKGATPSPLPTAIWPSSMRRAVISPPSPAPCAASFQPSKRCPSPPAGAVPPTARWMASLLRPLARAAQYRLWPRLLRQRSGAELDGRADPGGFGAR